MERTTIDFGIDLGTTNSTVAVIDGIDAKVIPNKGGSSITASAVWIDKREKLHIGQEAKLRALVDDKENGDLEFKLRMGLGADGKKVFVRSGREMLPEELSAEVLKSLKNDVTTNLGEAPRAAVITVPAAFENPSTNATRKAAVLAGFELSPLLLEPVAASLAYGFQTESENVYWLVYDFGGGTFDAAVMRIRDGLIQVVNHDGDNFLGGKLIDWEIVTKKLVPAITNQFNLPDFRRGNQRWDKEMGVLKWHAEQAKIEVCRTKAPFEIFLDTMGNDADGKQIEFVYNLTPEDVKEVSKPFIVMSLNHCRKVLQHIGLKASDMERVLMVGGSTLNPWLREAAEAELGPRLEFGIGPVPGVARGAAIFAGTQPLPRGGPVILPAGTWEVQIEHRPIGNVADPDIGGRVVHPAGQSLQGFTIELVDTKSQWRSGRITLGSDGVFITQLYAEKQRRHEYVIELCDPTGTRLPTSPERISYTLGVIPDEHPPAAMTIGIGLATGEMKPYIMKGTKLPARKSMDHLTTVPLRAGHNEDELHIPLLEGEHPRAQRNHLIGAVTIRGSDIRRDLPVGSQIEISVRMGQSGLVGLQAYVNSLDEDLDELKYDPGMLHSSLTELRKEAKEQKERLTKAREQADRTAAPKAREVLSWIDDQQLLDQIESLLLAAQSDQEAIVRLDRLLRELAAAVDELEDAVEWPVLLEKADESKKDAEKVTDTFGDASDKDRLASLTNKLQQAIGSTDPDLVRSYSQELDQLYFRVLDRQPGYHIALFEWLVERKGSMRDPAQAEQIIAQGRRAINNNDIEAVKAANRQLRLLLPRKIQEEARHANIGGTITRD